MNFLRLALNALACLLITAVIAIAQDDPDSTFDFGDLGSFDAEATDTDGDVSAVGPAVVEDGTDGDDEETLELDPAVNEIVLSDPQSPDELVRAIDVLSKLDRHELAKGYLQKLVDLQLDRVALANLQRRVGSGVLVKLSVIRELNPQAREFARSALNAASTLQQDPTRIASVIEQFQSTAPDRRRRLARELINTGPAAVAPMLSVVASDPSGEISPLLRTSIVAIGKPAIGPLLAHLDSDNQLQQIEAVRILGHMRAERALPFLARYAELPDGPQLQAVRNALHSITGSQTTFADLLVLTTKVASDRYDGRISIDVHANGKADAWIWDGEANAPTRKEFLPRDIAMFEAAQHYRTLSLYSSTDHNRLRRLISGADAAKVQGGLDLPIDPNSSFLVTAKATDPHLVSKAYETAMTDRQVPAMIGLAEALGHIGDANVLASVNGRPSPLATGMTHANPRVRFAAASAIAKLGPEGSFAGSSHLAESLAHFGSSKGRRGALVAHPRAETAQSIAGLLKQFGFDVDIAVTSRETLRLSTESFDYEFFLISDAFDRPVTHQLVQRLRQNPLTASLPIGILARPEERTDAHIIADFQPKVITLPESKDPATIGRAITRLNAIAGRVSVSAVRRGEMAYVALSHLSELAKAGQLAGADLSRFVHQVKRPSTTRGLALKSMEVLGRSGSPDAQAALLEIANQHLLPIEQRIRAAEAFDESVRRFGIMLTKRQVSSQYAFYNASESADQPTQQVMSAVLDSIENRLTN